MDVRILDRPRQLDSLRNRHRPARDLLALPGVSTVNINDWLMAEHQPGESNLDRILYMVKEISPRCGSKGPFQIYFADSDWQVEYTITKSEYLDHAWKNGEVIR